MVSDVTTITSRAVTTFVLLAAALVVPARSAVASAPGCGAASASRGVVVLVHDLAATSSAMEPVRARLAGDGYCVVNQTYGRTVDVLGLLPGGMRAVDQQVAELTRTLAAVRREHPRAAIHLVAHGVGSLVALRQVQVAGRGQVRSITALGPLWNGTNILGLGDLEQLSRDAGTYDLVLGLEKLALDPVCSVCREFVRGSDFLRSLRAGGLVRPGIRQTSIVTRTDGFVEPYTSGIEPGMRSIVVQDDRPSSTVGHHSLPSDVQVLGLVEGAIRAAGR